MEIKPQDILFFITLIPLFILKKTKWFIFAGLFCFLLAAPLFGLWIFFTAQKLIWYALMYISIAVVWNTVKYSKDD
jgi:threonine/homoserine/homoserine lactone efflux protein